MDFYQTWISVRFAQQTSPFRGLFVSARCDALLLLLLLPLQFGKCIPPHPPSLVRHSRKLHCDPEDFITLDREWINFTHLPSTGMVSPKLPDPASWLPLAAGASSSNLGSTFFTIPREPKLLLLPDDFHYSRTRPMKSLCCIWPASACRAAASKKLPTLFRAAVEARRVGGDAPFPRFARPLTTTTLFLT